MSAPRVLVLSGVGINCERETAAAFQIAGARAETVHTNALVRDPGRIDAARIVVFPGGFAFGDRLGAGQALANRIRHRKTGSGRPLLSELKRFLKAGGYLLGICNGFQVLAKLGLLPDTGGDGRQEAALAENESGRFEDRWCRLGPAARGAAAALGALGPMELPVRHREGRLVLRDDAVREAVVEAGLNWLTYLAADGGPAASYPANPSGTELGCAGLVDPTGHVFGLMPHPEAYVSVYTHYNWPRRCREGLETEREADGLRLIRAFVRLVSKDEDPPRGGKEEP